ncbi:embryonic protein UVS.2-like isoform X2 [Mytilus edulis]|uniref:embryonic protein UVS.2-like isoform X2 n=1 Tax=Mytilus edulis TaxID=6550 RepID=UPI0039EFC661
MISVRYLLLCVLLSLTIYQVAAQCSGTPAEMIVGYSITSITPPGYPNGYAGDLNCSWIARTQVQGDVLLIMSTENTVSCSGDTVNVHDGQNSSANTLGDNHCSDNGNVKTSGFMVTTAESAYIEFVSDGISAATEKGFDMKIISGHDFGSACSSPVTLSATSNLQYITSPSFPESYTTDKDCQWVIQTTLGRVILNLMFMDIEFDASCQYDHLKVTDEGYSLMLCKEKFWSEITYISNGTSITVDFHSDNEQTKHGFILSYQQTDLPCSYCSANITKPFYILTFILSFCLS